MKVVKHVKSNAIVVVKNRMALGIGTGEVNRIWATQQAIERAGEGVVLASDAFFPFRDVVDCCAEHHIRAIIQPGGSVRDQESIDACDEHEISRSEEHTSELQSRQYLVCRLLLEKKKN